MKKFYIIPVLSILIVIAIGLFIVQPKISEISDLSQKITTEKEKNTKLTAKRDALTRLRDNKEEITAKGAAVRVALPSEKNITQYLLELDNLAQASNIVIRSVQVTPGTLIEEKPTITQAADELVLNIAIEGSFESIKTFFERVSQAKRLINAQSLNIAINSETSGTVSASGVFNIYYKQRPQTPKDATEAIPELTPENNETFDEISNLTSY